MPFAVRTRADDADKHGNDVNALIYHKNKLYSGADDGKIKVWEEDLKLAGEVKAHETSVYHLAASDDTLYSCSNDGTIKAWTLDLKEKSVLTKAESEIWRIVYSDGILYAGDNEGVVRIFVNDQLSSNVNLLEPIKDMLVVGNLVYTVRDLDVVITEVFPGETGKFGNRTNMVGRAPMCIAGDKLCVSGREGKDIIIHENSLDLKFKEVTQIKDAHPMIINTLCGVKSNANTLLYSGGWDKVVKQWKIVGNKVESVASCNTDMVVNVLAAGPLGEIYAGGSDGHIVRIDV